MDNFFRFFILAIWGLTLWGKPVVVFAQDTGTSYYDQEIRFLAKDVSEASLVWGVNGWQLTPEQKRRPNTIEKNKVLSTPMEIRGDTLLATLSVREGDWIDFMLSATKDAQGKEIALWDLGEAGANGYHQKAARQKDLLYRADLSLAQKDKLPHIWRFTYWLFGLSIAMFFLIILFLSLSKKELRPASYWQKISLYALSAYLFHFAARVKIFHYSARQLDLTYLGLGAYDLIFILSCLAFFAFLGLGFKKERQRKILLIVWAVLCFLLVSTAILNIVIVDMLGRAFNYSWLYYSDFLASSDAKSAVLTTASFKIVLEVIVLGVSMLLLTSSMIKVINILKPNQAFLRLGFGLAGVLCLWTMLAPIENKFESLPKGKLENPIVSFVSSAFNAEAQTNLYTLDTSQTEFVDRASLDIESVDREYGKLKNVVLVVLESAAAEYFDLYGGKHELSPVLNQYYEQSILFENIYAHAPATNKSLFSLLCSHYPLVSYQTITQENPNIKLPSLSETLNEQGYNTSFFSAGNLKFQRSDEFLAKRGFDYIADFAKISCAENFSQDQSEILAGVDDMCLISSFAERLDQAPQAPFFSMLWTNQGHYPYLWSGPERAFEVATSEQNRYLNTLEHYDAVLGALIDSLKHRKLFDSTLIVIIGDHGEAFRQHGQTTHASHLYEENVHVPMLMINPILFEGERRKTIGGMIDIAPTILGLLAQEQPTEWHGHNLLTERKEHPVFFFSPWSNYLFACRSGNLKIIFDETHQQVELFDLRVDPLEQHNIADQFPEEVKNFRYQIAKWIQAQAERNLNQVATPQSP